MPQNGTKSAIAVIVFITVILGSAITIYSVFHAPLARALEEEKTVRQKMDTEITKQLTDAVTAQQKTNETTNILLAKITTQLSYIERAVKQ